LIDSVIVGDTDPCIVGYAVERLQRLETVSNPLLSPETDDLTTVLSVVRSDADLHDRLLGVWTESLEQWLVLAYLFDENAVWIAQAYDAEGRLTGPVLATRVPINSYIDVARQVGSYWREHSTVTK
jgi:hypothetical protein